MPDQNGLPQLGDFVTTTDVEGEIVDFSFSLTPKRFRVNDDVFLAAPELPLNILSIVGRFKNITADTPDVDERLLEFFDAVLLDASAQRMRERARSKDTPMPFQVMMPIIQNLMERYGLRPTVPSSPSPSTSESVDGSTTSTAGASPGTSTGDGSPSTAS